MESFDRRAKVHELEQEFNRLFVRRRFNALQLARQIDSEIEPASYSVLATLQQMGPQRMTAIARHLGIGKPTLSRQLSTLEHRGFVEKATDPADGRAQMVSLTEEGRARLESAQGDRAERYLQMLTPWQEQEIETLSKLLAKLNKAYTEFDAEHDPSLAQESTVPGAVNIADPVQRSAGSAVRHSTDNGTDKRVS
ncbi:MarR family winged helix-turn-helix transcriptional regulator [Nesterenkonia sp. LB17]|uniref:MarR family winged helix-turn-helix transcriptional regulator n=1 Tax=unclassified Nesterenkonia TaxID=2629769 RepID=UPI001F4D294C|nr:MULTISPECIES: MarR family winged helix-turn-helix transcriptional regulator [unclassified Nesterenkonia]MCH8559606.1 MarR family winged helix-turn-helix transcriptional regulator [Nesterenkonia sp. DZ6]MCH8564687.1 MarR family winged helix-turn-helix transcriptional regulator [Nesterenkonia sp. LB17]MCH8570307.1 MarR family winged helix-turn-helix transcriptional regulator [Nesterenkonia sp. AY15]